MQRQDEAKKRKKGKKIKIELIYELIYDAEIKIEKREGKQQR